MATVKYFTQCRPYADTQVARHGGARMQLLCDVSSFRSGGAGRGKFFVGHIRKFMSETLQLAASSRVL